MCVPEFSAGELSNKAKVSGRSHVSNMNKHLMKLLCYQIKKFISTYSIYLLKIY